MHGRERLLRAFHQVETDRIPVAPFIHVNFVKEFFSDHDVDVVSGTIEVYRHFGFDLMHRNCSAAYDHFTAVESEDWRVERSVERDGRDETVTTVVRTPGGEIRRVTATRWIHEYECESSVVEYPVKSEQDLELCRRYMPPVGTVDTGSLRRARELVGDEGIVAPWVQGLFNELAIHYRKLDDLLLDAILRPDFYAGLADFAFARLIEIVRQNIDAGADVLSAGGNVANGKIVGPDFFEEHIAPREERLVRYVQGRGATLLYHNCGWASRLLKFYPRIGLRAYESLTPPPHGDTVLSDAFRAFDPARTTLLGNIDQITLLREGSPADVEAAAAEAMEAARARGGSFILGTTDYFHENTPHENIRALAEAGRRHGGRGWGSGR